MRIRGQGCEANNTTIFPWNDVGYTLCKRITSNCLHSNEKRSRVYCTCLCLAPVKCCWLCLISDACFWLLCKALPLGCCTASFQLPVFVCLTLGCFHTDIIKSTLIHYLCILLLNYSHNSFMCYCIFFFFLSRRQFELAWLPLLNIPSLKIVFLLINPPSLSFCSNTQCSHVKAVLANFFLVA